MAGGFTMESQIPPPGYGCRSGKARSCNPLLVLVLVLVLVIERTVHD